MWTIASNIADLSYFEAYIWWRYDPLITSQDFSQIEKKVILGVTLFEIFIQLSVNNRHKENSTVKMYS